MRAWRDTAQGARQGATRLEHVHGDYSQALKRIIKDYESTMRNGSQSAAAKARQSGRKIGGVLRARKGGLQERITEGIIRAALVDRAGVDPSRIRIDKAKVCIPLRPGYRPVDTHLEMLAQLGDHAHSIHFAASVDRHVFIDGKLVCGIECKAYTENAMLKRILVDFHLLKKVHPDIVPMLFQLESMLGGDYHTCASPCRGSPSTHTLLSHFPDVPLRIVTLLEGERNVDRPIDAYPKPLKFVHLDAAATRFLTAIGM